MKIESGMSLKRHQHEETDEQWFQTEQKRRRLSDPAATPLDLDHTPKHDLEPVSHQDIHQPDDGRSISSTNASTAKLTSQAVAPFLARHIPNQYAPLGSTNNGTTIAPKDPNSKFCYRHRPDMLCRRQADEPSMDKLQNVSGP